MAYPFIDANILLRHLLADHPDHSPKATALIARIERGELEAQLSEMVIFETVFTLHRTYKIDKDEIRRVMLDLLSLPGIILPGKRRYERIFELFVDQNMDFGDAYIVVDMERAGASELFSFDTGYDKLPGITRTEPVG